MATTNENASKTPEPIRINNDAGKTTLYQNGSVLSLGDATHDGIIESGELNNPVFECDYFYKGLPESIKTKYPCIKTGTSVGLVAPTVPAKLKSLHCEEKLVRLFVTHRIPNALYNKPNFINGTAFNAASEVDPSTFLINDLQDKDAIKTKNGNVYYIRRIAWGTDYNIGVDDSSICGKKLMDNLGLEDGTMVSIDVDVVRFFKQLKKGPKVKSNVFILMNPESACDSAQARYHWLENELFKLNSGVDLKFAGKMNSYYPIWSLANRNTFYSNYKCEMIIQDWELGHSNGGVIQTWKNNTNVGIEQNAHPSAANSKKSVRAKILQLINDSKNSSISQADKEKILERLGLLLQIKRSGDQLQANAVKILETNSKFHLSAPDGTNPPTTAKFVQKQITSSAKNNNNINVKKHTYILTHDSNLLVDALQIGDNVIFQRSAKNYKIIIIFRLISLINNNNF